MPAPGVRGFSGPTTIFSIRSPLKRQETAVATTDFLRGFVPP